MAEKFLDAVLLIWPQLRVYGMKLAAEVAVDGPRCLFTVEGEFHETFAPISGMRLPLGEAGVLEPVDHLGG